MGRKQAVREFLRIAKELLGKERNRIADYKVQVSSPWHGESGTLWYVQVVNSEDDSEWINVASGKSKAEAGTKAKKFSRMSQDKLRKLVQ